jgi:hypothetical protein
MRATNDSRSSTALVGSLSLALVLAFAGCPVPAQEGGLRAIDTEGLAERMRLLCRSGHADPACAGASAFDAIAPGTGLAPAIGSPGEPDALATDSGVPAETSRVFSGPREDAGSAGADRAAE